MASQWKKSSIWASWCTFFWFVTPCHNCYDIMTHGLVPFPCAASPSSAFSWSWFPKCSWIWGASSVNSVRSLTVSYIGTSLVGKTWVTCGVSSTCPEDPEIHAEQLPWCPGDRHGRLLQVHFDAPSRPHFVLRKFTAKAEGKPSALEKQMGSCPHP
jgi:hypothetical protein